MLTRYTPGEVSLGTNNSNSTGNNPVNDIGVVMFDPTMEIGSGEDKEIEVSCTP